ncbi:MAG: transposase [Desulfurivibrionaceae bacterium]|jgi:REP element-mobilizing transposase RayT
MARPLRLEFPEAVYHVTSRGNARQDIFIDDSDRERFLAILSNTVHRYNWVCHAYCLMDNHYHLLLETLDPNLSSGMRQLNGMYTQAFNRQHDRVGHVFQGRYKAILIEKDAHLLELCRYIVLNPVAAGIVAQPEAWPWSSCRGTLDADGAADFLTTTWVLGQFSRNRTQAKVQYRHFIAEELQSEPLWNTLHGQSFLGSAAFAGKLNGLFKEKQHAPEVPRKQRYIARPPLDELFTTYNNKTDRNRRVAEAHVAHGYLLKEIAEHLGIHYTTVSKIIKGSMEKNNISRPDPRP